MIDTYLSKLTRRVSRVRGSQHLIRPLSRFFSEHYTDRPDRWAVIDDFDGSARMRVDRSSYLGSLVYWFGHHHRDELDFLRRTLRAGMCFADVGANQGEFTILAARHLAGGQVLAFEPHPETRHALERNIALNGFDNVEVFDHALGREEGDAILFTAPRRDGEAGWNDGLYSIYQGETRSEGGAKTRIRRLDDVVAERGITRIDLMKVDVEGAELDVILGAERSLARFRPTLILEIGEAAFREAGYATADLLDRLSEHHYRTFGFTPLGAAEPSELSREQIEKRALQSSFNVLCRPEG